MADRVRVLERDSVVDKEVASTREDGDEGSSILAKDSALIEYTEVMELQRQEMEFLQRHRDEVRT